MTESQRKKKRKELLKDLDYLTSIYKELSPRAPQVIQYIDEQIERIIEQLKKLGK